MKVLFLVFARDDKYVDEKISELNRLDMPYLLVCGTNLNYPGVVFRNPRGKFDAINFGAEFVPRDVDVVALNDVDTKINNLQAALRQFDTKDVALVFARVSVREGPQKSFYVILDAIRRRVPINASGELMFIKRSTFAHILPVIACKAEDSYILFKVRELKHKVVFCEECSVETERTMNAEEEEDYKRRTVCGLYQALGRTRPPIPIRLFYVLLPFASPMLLVLGKKGYFWTRGIILGLADYLRGDRLGFWQQTYSK
jgi:hypothetical protein